MLAVSVPETGIKDFMNKLLREDMFDGFECRSAVVCSFARFEITGEKPSCCLWKNVRQHVFNIIKGSEKPRSIKIVFALNNDETAQQFPEASALFLNILFDNGKVMLTTGASEKTLSLRNDLGRRWAEYMLNILVSGGLTLENI